MISRSSRGQKELDSGAGTDATLPRVRLSSPVFHVVDKECTLHLSNMWFQAARAQVVSTFSHPCCISETAELPPNFHARTVIREGCGPVSRFNFEPRNRCRIPITDVDKRKTASALSRCQRPRLASPRYSRSICTSRTIISIPRSASVRSTVKGVGDISGTGTCSSGRDVNEMHLNCYRTVVSRSLAIY